jgi:hypothetical protein
MSPNASVDRHSPADGHDGAKAATARVAGMACVAALTLLTGFLIVTGPTIRAAAERQEAEQIELEDKIHCRNLGIGSDRFAACAGALADIRKLHDARLNERARL